MGDVLTFWTKEVAANDPIRMEKDYFYLWK
jgi:hypothetical protein